MELFLECDFCQEDCFRGCDFSADLLWGNDKSLSDETLLTMPNLKQ